MKKLQNEKMEMMSGGRRFFGPQTTSCEPVMGPNGPLYYFKCQQTYIFWIGMGTACEPTNGC